MFLIGLQIFLWTFVFISVFKLFKNGYATELNEETLANINEELSCWERDDLFLSVALSGGQATLKDFARGLNYTFDTPIEATTEKDVMCAVVAYVRKFHVEERAVEVFQSTSRDERPPLMHTLAKVEEHQRKLAHLAVELNNQIIRN